MLTREAAAALFAASLAACAKPDGRELMRRECGKTGGRLVDCRKAFAEGCKNNTVVDGVPYACLPAK